MDTLKKAEHIASFRHTKVTNSECHWQKSKKKNTGNCKAFCVSQQRNHPIVPCKSGYTRSNKLNQRNQIIQILPSKTNSS